MLREDKRIEVVNLLDRTIQTLEEVKEELNYEGNRKVNLVDLVEVEDVSGGENEDIIRDYNQGMTSSDIQRRYGISSGTLYSILRRNNVELRHGKTLTSRKIKEMGEEKVEAIISEYVRGTPNKAILEYYDINKHTLYTILDMYDVNELKGGIY